MRYKKIIILIVLILITQIIFGKAKSISKLKGKNPTNKFILEFMMGYSVPINCSYIDTYKNQDIYWNPNSGVNFDLRFTVKFNDYLSLSFPIDLTVGYYQYTTTDGRKINTEDQAGNQPITTNREWSVAPNFAVMLMVKPGKHPAVPYFSFGIGVAFLWSFESWDFTNVNNQSALLMIAKYYYPTPSFKGEIGWFVPITKKLSFRIAGVFNLSNFIMYRVELTNYYIDGEDTIGNYNEKDTVYSYAFNVPDENKGGDCLLAGFAYQNYPQQKIGTNLSLKIGFSFNF